MANINKIKLSGTTYNIQDENATKTVELTQAQYDALAVKDPNTFYIITDAQGADLSNYYTKSETSGATQISTALASKQTTLTAGTNITIVDNVISATGGGGGGKAVSGGTNISITTGETADTINCTLPITATTDTTNKAIMIGQSITASTNSKNGCVIIGSAAKGSLHDVIIGNQAKNNSNGWNEVVVIGNEAKAYSEGVAIGAYAETYNHYREGSVAIGYYTRAKNMADAVAIGHNVQTTGTTKTNINNQLTIDTSNQVYIYNKDNTEMICLQDQLGGGGSSYTAGNGIDITNDVISVTGKVDTSAITTSITSANTNTQVPSAKAVYDQLGGLKLVKLSQSAYDSLATKDSMTLYIIEEAPQCNVPSTATWHSVDATFDRTTQIYGVDFSNGDGGNDGTGRDYSLYVRNQSNTVYIINCHIPYPNDESGDYNSITINNSDGSLYRQIDNTAIINSFCDIFGEPMYISDNATIPSYEQCVDEQCTEYECLQYDEETGECIEQGAGCISSECMQYQTTYFITVLY